MLYPPHKLNSRKNFNSQQHKATQPRSTTHTSVVRPNGREAAKGSTATRARTATRAHTRLNHSSPARRSLLPRLLYGPRP